MRIVYEEVELVINSNDKTITVYSAKPAIKYRYYPEYEKNVVLARLLIDRSLSMFTVSGKQVIKDNLGKIIKVKNDEALIKFKEKYLVKPEQVVRSDVSLFSRDRYKIISLDNIWFARKEKPEINLVFFSNNYDVIVNGDINFKLEK